MHRYCILLVDDEPDIRASLKRACRMPEYEILEAEDGIEALEIIKQREVDAVIADYNMPRMDGLTLLQQVRLRNPDVLRMVITARVDVHLAVRAINEGSVHRFFLKPWDNVDLRGILQTALHSVRPGPPAAAVGGQ